MVIVVLLWLRVFAAFVDVHARPDSYIAKVARRFYLL